MTFQARAGNYKEFLLLFFPVLIIAVSGSIYFLVEKLLFGAFSTLAMEAAVTVAYIAQIFQLCTVAVAMMSQVFIGQQYGNQDWKSMGPCVWQYIWFSLMSTCIAIPVGMLYGMFYLKGIPFEDLASPYLYFLLLINFLYPLGMALSCFYIAQKKTRLVLFSTIGSQVVKIILAYLLIPYLAQKSPLWGLYGGALSTFIAQSLFVLVLFCVFINAKHAERYGSRNWPFQIHLFWESIRPGLLRGTNRILNTLCWASITHLMVSKSELHLLTFSIGGVIFLFLPSIGDAICQAQTVITSRLVGAKNFPELFIAFKPGFICTSICIALFMIPLVLFPYETFHVLFPKISIEADMIRPIFLGIWISFAFFAALYVPLGYILAFKDMSFSAFMGIFGWVNGYLYMFFVVDKWKLAPQYFWVALSVMHASNALIYFLRAKWLCSRALFSEDFRA